MKNFIKYIPVAVQTAAMCFIIFTTSRFPTNPVVLALLLLSAGLLVWSVRAMGSNKFNMSPELHERAELCTTGPYRYIRHPMYAAVLAFTLVLVVIDFGWARAGVWAILLANMSIKMIWEEWLLSRTLPGYEEYRRRTKRIIPFVL